jgi:hypothetical protein
MRARVSAKLAPIAPQPTTQTFNSHPLKFLPALCSWKKGDAAEAIIISPLTSQRDQFGKFLSAAKNLSEKLKGCKGLLEVFRKSNWCPKQQIANCRSR